MPRPGRPIFRQGHPHHMILWTIQSLSAWEILQSRGFLQARRPYVEKLFRLAYRWMQGQMRKRLWPPPSSACFPLWAWFQWQGSNKKRPDLRFSGHLPRGDTGVLIEFHADAAEVILSDFELWHYVLNYWHLPNSIADEARFDAILASLAANTPSEVTIRNRSFHSDIQKSWERIFNIQWSKPDIASEFTEKQIQATLWRLNRNKVRNFTIFRAH